MTIKIFLLLPRVFSRKSLVTFFVLLVFSSIALSAVESPKRVAILSTFLVQDTGLSDMLLLSMQNSNEFEMVERDLIKKVSQEVSISLSLGPNQGANRIKAGQLLNADMLVFLSLENDPSDKDNKELILTAMVSDCKTGARLSTAKMSFDKSNLKSFSEDLNNFVLETLRRFKDGVKQVVGISYFMSDNIDQSYDYLQYGYVNVISNALSTLPGIAVIEIEEASAILREIQAGGEFNKSRKVPVFIEGDFKITRTNGKKLTDINVRFLDGAKLLETFQKQKLDERQISSFLAEELPLEISKYINLDINISKEKQIELLVKNSDKFAKIGNTKPAAELLGAAVLLNPESADLRIKAIKRGSGKIDNLSYLILNHKINIVKATELIPDSIYNHRFGEKVPGARDFWRKVYPKTLDLEMPDPNEDEYIRKWYGVFNRCCISYTRYGQYGYPEKEDLDLYFDLLQMMPENCGPSTRFCLFLEDHAKIGWRKLTNSNWAKRSTFMLYPSYFTDTDFVDFIDRLYSSEKPLVHKYGEYALTLREYSKIHKKGGSMALLSEKIDMLIARAKEEQYISDDLGRKGKPIYIGYCKLKEKIEKYIVGIDEKKTKKPFKTPIGIEERKVSPIPNVMGKIHFRHLCYDWTSKNRYYTRNISNNQFRGFTACGKVDIFCEDHAILIMRDNLLWEELYRDQLAHFDDVKWDGKYIWIATRNDGIWICDQDGEFIYKIKDQNGLLPCDNGILLHTISEGKMFAVGSSGEMKRAWLAIVDYENKKANVNVFHEAKNLRNKGSKKEEYQLDTELVFVPAWIQEYSTTKTGDKILIIGRSSEKRYKSNSDNRCYSLSLKVDLANLAVSIYREKLNSVPYDGCTEFRSDYPEIGDSYLIGWRLVNKKTFKQTKLITKGNLPEPYSKIKNIKKSAHYGLVGWISDTIDKYHIFGPYQIKISDDEYNIVESSLLEKKQDGSCFHTFTFEGANGPISSEYFNKILITVMDKYEKEFGSFYLDELRYGGYFPQEGQCSILYLGDDSRYGKLKPLKFNDITIEKNTPENIVFKSVDGNGIKFTGHITDSTTQKPVPGAFVMIGYETNFAEVNDFEWQALKSLPEIVSMDDKRIMPIAEKYFLNVSWFSRADKNGNFEIISENYDIKGNIIAFDKDYLECSLEEVFFPEVKNAICDLGNMEITPAAKIKLETEFTDELIVNLYSVRIDCQFKPEQNLFHYQDSQALNPYVLPYHKKYYIPANKDLKIKLVESSYNWDLRSVGLLPKDGYLNLKQGQEFDLGKLTINRTVRAKIRLTDKDGKPLNEFPICFESIKDPELDSGNSYTTSSAGTFELYVGRNKSILAHFGDYEKGSGKYVTHEIVIDRDDVNSKLFEFVIPDNIINAIQ